MREPSRSLTIRVDPQVYEVLEEIGQRDGTTPHRIVLDGAEYELIPVATRA